MLTAELKGNKLVLTIDLNAEATPSSTGKMLLHNYVQWTDLGVSFGGRPLKATLSVGCKNPEYGANTDEPAKAPKVKNPVSGRFGPKVVVQGAIA
jgi:hypothetical protein